MEEGWGVTVTAEVLSGRAGHEVCGQRATEP